MLSACRKVAIRGALVISAVAPLVAVTLPAHGGAYVDSWAGASKEVARTAAVVRSATPSPGPRSAGRRPPRSSLRGPPGPVPGCGTGSRELMGRRRLRRPGAAQLD